MLAKNALNSDFFSFSQHVYGKSGDFPSTMHDQLPALDQTSMDLSTVNNLALIDLLLSPIYGDNIVLEVKTDALKDTKQSRLQSWRDC